MKPTYSELLSGATRWIFRDLEIPYELAFHGYSEDARFPSAGTWCYYLLLAEQQFLPEDWAKLCFEPEIRNWGQTYPYHQFPDIDFHGGVTFYEIKEVWDKQLAKKMRVVKVGCDYNHLWDSERGYPDTLENVKLDAQRSVRELLDLFPNRNKRCEYSGRWDAASEFYTAKNGRTVHNSFAATFEDGWDSWRPCGP